MNKRSSDRTLLVVEDSSDDYEALARVMKKIGFAVPVVWCKTGAEMLEVLQKATEKPGLILLDLNIPGINGAETLRRLKEDSALKAIPVIIFSTSASARDIENCYRLGANSYIQKPFSLSEITDIMTAIKRYWFEVAILP
jgi:two-component system response regulator